MPLTATLQVSASIAGGANVSTSQVVAIEAYDEIEIEIDAGATDEAVEVQPGGAGQVRLLIVTSSVYDSALSYKVNDAGNPAHELDRPLMLAGDGAVGLLGFAPTSLLFSNATAGDATVHILVGRNAT